MNIVDIIIILIIILCGLCGLKRGVIKESVSFFGLFIVVILAFLLKSIVSEAMYTHLPFFSFNGIFKGIEVLNILLYEIIAFIVVLTVLTIVLKVLIKLTSLIEKLLRITIVLGIPSKILGFVVGVIEGIVTCFIFLYILSLPLFNISIIRESKFREPILKNMPILSEFTSDFASAIGEFSTLKETYEDTSFDKDEFNKEAMEIFVKYRIIDIDNVKLLKDKGKLNFNGIDEIIDMED